jgi:hypothetical protein
LKRLWSAIGLFRWPINARKRRANAAGGEDSYTSTGVRPPWVTEQQTAPAKANLE